MNMTPALAMASATDTYRGAIYRFFFLYMVYGSLLLGIDKTLAREECIHFSFSMFNRRTGFSAFSKLWFNSGL